MSAARQSKVKLKEPVRMAVVGLGHFAQQAILPAFKALSSVRLVALVSDDPEKRAALKSQYDVESVLPYEEYDGLLASGTVDAVYIALPNSLHREYVERAARAHVHVLCEKPMALSVVDCQAMITACREAGVKLQVGYRLHFDQANLEAIELVKGGKLGDVRLFNSVFASQVTEDNIRTRGELGGGPLYDIGIYCINAARNVFQAEPESVFATMVHLPDDERFEEVESTVSAILRFPGERLATFTASFASADQSRYEINGSEGTLIMDPAYDHSVPLAREMTVKGRTSTKKFKHRDQIAGELNAFALSVREDTDPDPSGYEGLLDVRVIEACFESARSGALVKLGPARREDRPGMNQLQQVPREDREPTVNVQPPSRDEG